ncbi:MAG: magnesium transporter [Sandaracinaceae bacterium]
MRLATLLGPDLKVTLQTAPAELHEALEEFHPEDIAEIVEDLDLATTLDLMRALPADFGAAVLERLSPELQEDIFEGLEVERGAEVLAEMSPDDRADALQELGDELARSLLTHLDSQQPEVAEEARSLAAYPEDVAGGLMTTDYVSLGPDTKVWQAIEEVRRVSQEDEAETVYYIYVVYGSKLLGVVSLRELILSDPGQTLAEVMTENVVTVRDDDDQELVARTMAKYDFNAIPVVDAHGQLLGVVTVDDVVDVVIEEATEDAHLMGAVSPFEEGYFETDLIRAFRSRVTWLTVLFFGGLLTATVMERSQSTLQQVIALAVFVPLIISSGGNAGSQSASLIIRALAVGEVEPRDWLRVLSREALVSLALGLVLAALGFARVFFLGDDLDLVPLAMTVSLSILAVVVGGSLVGSLLPIGIQRVGFDPAVSSTPFIASVVDVFGLLVYLSVARVFLLGPA